MLAETIAKLVQQGYRVVFESGDNYIGGRTNTIALIVYKPELTQSLYVEPRHFFTQEFVRDVAYPEDHIAHQLKKWMPKS